MGYVKYRLQEERNPLHRLHMARSQHLFFKSPKIFQRRRFYIGESKKEHGGPPGKHPFFLGREGSQNEEGMMDHEGLKSTISLGHG
jgi:hypothetical protein